MVSLPGVLLRGRLPRKLRPPLRLGVLGRTFPTPFASPPFRGSSSPHVNVLYGVCNLAFGLGLAAMALFITRSLARIQFASSASK
ncbi:hypothetical protein BH09MYX1_BH09MYX1_46600 [soil metagenome]